MNQHDNDNKDLARRTFLNVLGTVSTGALLSDTLFSSEQDSGNKVTRSPKGKVKIGQIGTGHVHAYKADTLRKLTDCFEFVAVAE
ncbi:MAG: hypothetical protein Q4G59_10855, partial [Planctomycetia bacterium]|nr:hypothetical protein [Planctomycetia bacterium]